MNQFQMRHLEKFFRKIYHASPALFVSAPGRINLIGEHTDYSEGFVFPAAIDRYISIAFTPRTDTMLSVYSIDYNQQFNINLQETFKSAKGWTDYILGVVWAFNKNNFKLRGFNGVISGNIPIGAGLSSSAALQVALVKAFLLSSFLDLSPVEIAKLCQQSEVEWIGVDVGIMDPLISSAGKANHALLIDCRSLEFDLSKIPEGIAFVVLDTNTRRKLTTSDYNLRHNEVAQASMFLDVPHLRDASIDLLQQKEREMPPQLYRRAKHVIFENQRVHEFQSAMRNNDLIQMGNLINSSHRSLRDDFQVSTSELDLIVNLALKQENCLAARLMGAGFGGCALALLSADQVKSFSSNISSAYQQETNIKPHIFEVSIADGVSWGKFENSFTLD